MKEGPRHRHRFLEGLSQTWIGKAILIILLLGIIGQILNYLFGFWPML
jgi:hypothetical protein